MKAYKGFDKDMKCRGFQFEEGKTYHEEKAELCKSGFHACTRPIDVLNYYSPGAGSIYREVELDEASEERLDDSSKVCAKTITIGAEIGIAGIVKAQEKWVKKQIEFDKAIESAKKSPDKHATGDCGAASATEHRGAASATGYQGAASATGDCGAASATGNQGAASATGRASAALAAGEDCKVMGAIGCAIFAVERGAWDGYTYPIISVGATIVDGEKIKANTWYKLKNGEFVEVA